MTSNILITRPKQLTSRDKKLLREDGVIVIESDDPDSIRFLTPSLEPSTSDLLYAALKTIRKGSWDTPKIKLAERIADMYISNYESEQPQRSEEDE